MYYCGQYLMHHGIKGQQWGIRRFQDESGSLTQAGKSRYRLGKQYSKERDKIEAEELDKIQKNNKQYQEVKAEVDRLSEKYGLENGEGGNTGLYDRETLRRANDRYWNQKENIEAMNEKYRKDARKKAETKIVEKYGEQALDDIQHYDTRRAANWLGAIGLVAVAYALRTAWHK